MVKLLMLITSTVGGGLGWWLGDAFGIMTAFMLSIGGTAIGVWGGRHLAKSWNL